MLLASTVASHAASHCAAAVSSFARAKLCCYSSTLYTERKVLLEAGILPEMLSTLGHAKHSDMNVASVVHILVLFGRA